MTGGLRRVFHWPSFAVFLQREIQVFLYLLFLLILFRIAFIGWMREYLGSAVTGRDLWTAMVYGMKLSLKSAGLMTLCSASAGLCAYLLRPRCGERVRRVIGGLFVLLLTVLFCVRIPYYAQFHSGFNQLIFNTLHDDVYALTASLIEQFYLPLRVLAALALAWLLDRLFVRWLRVPVLALPARCCGFLRYGARLLLLYILYQGSIFVQFGGSMSYEGNVDWENAGVTKDQLLNEAILDDLQALYRAYEMNGRLESSTGLEFEPRDIRGYAALLTGKSAAGDRLDDYLAKSAAGAPGGRTKHIFLIVSESYANWPLLPPYADLHLADGLRAMIAAGDGAYTGAFLPNGMSTISGVMGIVTGLADANLYLTTMPEAYRAPYPTAIAPQLRALGYRTRFWYAGPPSWERVREFSLAQGFQDFYGRGDYPDAPGNVWGCDDEALYRAILAGLDPAADSFNLILNVSNHSPYSVDLAAAGFDRAALAEALPVSARRDEDLMRALGHFWYADHMLARFVREAKRLYPESLFLIVGDHADRVNIDKTPSMYERYSVPFVISGHGITPERLPPNAAGSHIDLAPTLIELIAPRGFVYHSVGTSLTKGNALGVNYGFWITPTHIGKTDVQFAPEAFGAGMPPEEAWLTQYVAAVRSVSWWRGKYGNDLAQETGATGDGGGS